MNKFNQNSIHFNSKKEIYLTIIYFIKKFIKEIINFKKEKILDDYNKSVKSHFINDKYIIKWIKEYLDLNKENIIKGNIFNTKINYEQKQLNCQY